MLRRLFGLLFLYSTSVFTQNTTDSNSVDRLYLEDQIYFGVNYNFMYDKPDGIIQRNFSYGLNGGLIKDIPYGSTNFSFNTLNV